jgi:hypothetical protein
VFEARASEIYSKVNWSKVKVKLSLSTSWRHIGGVEVQLHSFLTSAWMWVSGELNALVVLPRKESPVLWVGSWVQCQYQIIQCLSDHVTFGCSRTCTFYIFWLCYLKKNYHLYGKILFQLTVTDEVIWSWKCK